MFKSLHLINFGKHKNLKLEFHKNITGIIGETNSGKSTIFRALYLLINNKPSNPEKYFNHLHKKENKFKIILQKDKCIIIREPKKYSLRKGLHEPQHFSAFGSHVPEPILNILKIKSINWQSQLFNQHYITFDTPGQIAKTINKEMGLEDAVLIINDIKGKISNSKGQLKSLQNEIITDSIKLEQLLKAKTYLKEANELNDIQNQILEFSKEEESLSKLLNKIENIDFELEEYDYIKIIYKEIEKLIELKKEVINQSEDILELSNLLKKINEIAINDLTLINKIINEIKYLLELDKKIDMIKDDSETLENLLSKISKTNEEIKTNQEEFVLLDKEFHKELKINGVCPFCGAKQYEGKI